MERYGDDAQRRMRTKDHVPPGARCLVAGAEHFGWIPNITVMTGLPINSFCAPRAKWAIYSFPGPYIENVAAGVCKQCGEKVLRPSVAKAIDSLLGRKCKLSKTVQVPVFTL